MLGLLLLLILGVWGAGNAQAEEPGLGSSSRSTFPHPEDTEPLASTHPQLRPQASTMVMELPEGFRASVFAAEPEVGNPIDLAWDHFGRMWVAENYTYAKSSVGFRHDLRDRVLVFTDEDLDGTPQRRTVFIDTLSKLTSVEVGPGPQPAPGLDDGAATKGVSGVWLMCPPQLLFVPDADRNLIPDSPPRVVLDGFDVAKQNYHNFANGLRFGPDGWLYGRCGGSCPGRVGAPGTPDEQRVALEGGIWRYHVRSERFEVLCHGTTNPWGHDFNSFGDLFFINTVNGHLWHGIHGAHFDRPFTLDPNPNVYATIDQHADHYHFDTGQGWRESRDGAANDFGGGHAHCGLMIYQESTWPESYRGSLMTLNLHGRRANRENLLRRGSGYVGTHGEDFLLSGDEWFRGMEMSAGPDGNVFVLDWSDLGECHESTGVHRNSGRVYKITWQPDNPEHRVPAPFAAAKSREHRMQSLQADDPGGLIEMILHQDRWFSHQAMMRLQGFKDQGQDLTSVINAIRDLAEQAVGEVDAATRCRLLYSLDRMGGLGDSDHPPTIDDLAPWLGDRSEHVRAAAIRVLSQHWPIDDVYGPTADSRAAWPEIIAPAEALVSRFEQVGAENSALVRLTLASTLQRLPESLRTGAAKKLLRLSGDLDRNDHNIPKMIWFGLMSRSASHPREMVDVAAASQLPELTTYLARSIAEQAESDPVALHELIAMALSKADKKTPAALRRDAGAVLTGIEQGMIGIRRTEMPPRWSELRSRLLAAVPQWQSRLEQLDILFGDGLSVTKLTELLSRQDAEPTKRLAALKGLVAAWHDGAESERREQIVETEELIAAARPLVRDPRVNLASAELLATIDHTDVAKMLAENYHRFRSPLRPQVVSLLCSRESFATVLIDRIEKRRLPKNVLHASHVRAISALGNEQLHDRVEVVWGRIQQTPADRKAEINRLTKLLTRARLADANRAAGRAIFDRTCSSCHRMFGNGEQVGPDLTGSQRSRLDYLLQNIVDPDALVGVDYRATQVLTFDGRLLVGLVTARTRRTLTIATAGRTETIPLDDIDQEISTDHSPMPSGLLQPLGEQQIIDLIAYLQSPVQVASQE